MKKKSKIKTLADLDQPSKSRGAKSEAVSKKPLLKTMKLPTKGLKTEIKEALEWADKMDDEDEQANWVDVKMNVQQARKIFRKYNDNDGEYGKKNYNIKADIIPMPKRSNLFESADLIELETTTIDAHSTVESKKKCWIGLFCDAFIDIPLDPRLRLALDKYEDVKKKYELRMVDRNSFMATRDRFCKLHQYIQVIIPDGLKKGYPPKIDINHFNLPIILAKIKPKLIEIINRKTKSVYLEQILEEYEKLGKWKAQAIENQVKSSFGCGYYGDVGTGIVFKYLQSKFIATKILTQKNCSPLSVVDFLNRVLVPECALRILSNDLSLNLEDQESFNKTMEILDGSSEYGNALFDEETDLLEKVEIK